MDKTYDCKLIKFSNQQQEWFEYHHKIYISISSLSISLRDKENHNLLCDFPIRNLQHCLIHSDTSIIRIVTISNEFNEFSLQFEKTSRDFDLCINKLVEFSYPFQQVSKNPYDTDKHHMESELQMPNLEDAEVQEFIIKILLNNDFKKFVHDLGQLLVKLQQQFSQYH